MYHYQRLRDLREDKDMTQSDIAKLLGTPFHHVITLAKFYNVSIDYLADLISEPKKLK